MAFLTPDLDRPVQLRLAAADVKREALGRTLSIAGAGIGIIGGLLFLSASPAVKAALKRGTAMSLTLQPAEAKREALGKSLALIGTGVGVVGTLVAFSSDQRMRTRLPMLNHLANPYVLSAIAVALAAGTVVLIRQQNQTLSSRYTP